MANRFKGVILAATFLTAASFSAYAQDHVAPATEFANTTVNEWVSDEAVIAAIKAQNEKHANLSEDEIVALDNQWRAETEADERAMIDGVLANDVSTFLAAKKEEAGGLVTEVFIMDNKGLNVGQSDVTSDYWQGDEGKFKKSFGAGPEAIFVDEVEHDESTQTFQTQVSRTIVDPETGEAIGAITVGVDVEAL